MFFDVVMEVLKYKFENVLDRVKEVKGYIVDIEFIIDDLKEIVKEFKVIYKKEIKNDFL